MNRQDIERLVKEACAAASKAGFAEGLKFAAELLESEQYEAAVIVRAAAAKAGAMP